MSTRALTRAVPAPKYFERCSTQTIACLPVPGMVLPRTRERFRGVDLERHPDTQRAGGKADHHRDEEYDRDALEIQHQPPRKVRLEDEDQCQPGEVTEYPHRKSLLDDKADNGPIRRADEFEGGDGAHLVHGQCVDCLLYTSPSPRDGLLS